MHMPDISSRLKKLAEYDSVSAEMLHEAFQLDSNPGPGPCPIQAVEASAISAWLASEEFEPNILILPAPSSPAQISAFLELVPEKCSILVVEKDPARAKHIFSALPVEDLISAKRLRMAIGGSEEVIDYQMITLLDLPKCPAVSIYTDNISSSADHEFYNTMLLRIRDRIRMKAFNLATVTHLGPLWQYNTLKNLPFIVANPGIRDLEGILKDRPAVVVAAGPSLNETMSHLAPVASKFAVIAVGTALKPLLKAGIRPDLVVTVDASHKVAAQFDIPCDDLCIASSSIIFPELLPRFSKVFTGYVNANTVGKWISSRFEDKGCIMAGGTVTASAIDLAVRMGCNPIITAGMDLAMAPDGRTHANNSMYHNQVSTLALVPVPGNYVPTVHTNTQFSIYAEAISDYVKSHPARTFINVTDQGARIEGMELALPHQIKRFSSTVFNAGLIIRKAHNRASVSTDLQAIIAEITRWKTAVSEIFGQALHAARICNGLIVTMKNPALSGTKEILDNLKILEEIDAGILDNEYCALLEMSLRPISYSMGADLKVQSSLESMSIEAVRRSRTLFQQIAGSAKWTGELLGNALCKLSSEQGESTTERINELAMSA